MLVVRLWKSTRQESQKNVKEGKLIDAGPIPWPTLIARYLFGNNI